MHSSFGMEDFIMSDIEFKPGITLGNSVQAAVMENTDNQAEEREFSMEESQNQLRANEEDFIQGLLEAAAYSREERQPIEIARKGKVYFRFSVRPLSEKEYDQCKKNSTKYVRNKNLGMRLPEETDSAKYRASLIYHATVEEDREKLWDDKRVWDTLRSRGMQIMNGTDVIEYSLKAGEKDKVIEIIDELSGYGSNLEEVVKN